MPVSNVIGFTENIPMKTAQQGLAFVARMRRQLDRYGVALPGKEGQCIDPEHEAHIRRICDDLEADIQQRPAAI